MGTYAAESLRLLEKFCRVEGFTSLITKLTTELEYLDKALTNYLDKKRGAFSRLYFTSNDELIGLMGNLTNKEYIQVFLSKLFDGIAGLMFEEKIIVGFYSKSNERIFFKDPISTDMPPEVWLGLIEMGMRRTLYSLFLKTIKEYINLPSATEQVLLLDWMDKSTGQLVILSAQVQFDMEMDKLFISRK